jgi:hypothetical protein
LNPNKNKKDNGPDANTGTQQKKKKGLFARIFGKDKDAKTTNK